MTDISGPVKAILNTRSARGTLAVEDLAASLDWTRTDICNVASIQVWGEPAAGDAGKPRELSMSWWLSKPVQIYLHEQTDYSGGKPVGTYSQNDKAIRHLVDAMRPAPPAQPAQSKPAPCSEP